jgi:hypothetical protein
VTPEMIARIDRARGLTRAALDNGSMVYIHPFDLCRWISDPSVDDVVIIHVDDLQYYVIEGQPHRCSSEVKNRTSLKEMMSRYDATQGLQHG